LVDSPFIRFVLKTSGLALIIFANCRIAINLVYIYERITIL
jgi:hypothetical protein